MNRENRLLKLSQITENKNKVKIDDSDKFLLGEKRNRSEYIYSKYMKGTPYEHLFPSDGLSYLVEMVPVILQNEFLDYNSDIIASAELKRYLGRGVYGVAYLTSSNTVFKIFTSLDDYNEYKKIYDQQYLGESTAFEPKIYSLGIFDTTNVEDYFTKPFVAYVEMEYLNIANKKKIPSMNEILIDREKLPEGFKRKKFKYVEIAELVRVIIYKTIEHIWIYMKNQDDAIDLLVEKCYDDLLNNNIFINKYVLDLASEALNFPNDQWYKNLIISIIRKYSNRRVDLHTGNLGFRNDKPIFFDS
jgi:hypothetical protein